MHRTLPVALLLALQSLAVAQTPQWVPLATPPFSARSAAFDLYRGCMVLFGSDGETWELHRGIPRHRQVLGPAAVAPPGRARGAMVFDLSRTRTILFGGVSAGNTPLGDTWAWDGGRWTQLANGPSARADAALAYDLVHDRCVLYGGQLLPGVAVDTWLFDGAQWTQAFPAHPPSEVNAPVSGYDLSRGEVVLVSHAGLLGAPVSTSVWNGSDWLLRANTGPTVSSNESLTYDLARLRIVMMGGVPTGNEIWEWDGTTWHQAGGNAPIRINPALGYDPGLGGVVLFGGTDAVVSGSQVQQGSARTDVWRWSGSQLQQLHGDLAPPSRYGHTLVADVAHDDVVLYGGVSGQAPVDETWLWHGTTWQRANPQHAPSPRDFAGGVYDLARSQPLLFGGFQQGLWADDLWAWTGTDWNLLATGGPSPRANPGMACDVLSGDVVLFGGSSGPVWQASSLRGDTWHWNGTAWHQRTVAVAPSPREAPAMCTDLARLRAVLFGGRTGATANDQLNDTWEWDGAQWRQIATATVPPALLMPSLVYDTARQRVVLTGTQLGPFAQQTWDYDGTNWTATGSTTASMAGTAVLAPGRQRLLLDSGTMLFESTATPAAVDDRGGACGAPAPRLLPLTRPRLGDAAFGLETLVVPAQPVVFAAATAPGSIALGNGCTLLLAQPVATAFALADAAGHAELYLPVPTAPNMRGVALHAQAVALTTGGAIVASNALRITVGD